MKLENMKPSSSPGLTTLTRVVILVALYFLGGLLGKQASFLSGSIALVWPPAGIALAAILVFGYRFWPGVALGGGPVFLHERNAVGLLYVWHCPGQHHGSHRLHFPA